MSDESRNPSQEVSTEARPAHQLEDLIQENNEIRGRIRSELASQTPVEEQLYSHIRVQAGAIVGGLETRCQTVVTQLKVPQNEIQAGREVLEKTLSQQNYLLRCEIHQLITRDHEQQ